MTHSQEIALRCAAALPRKFVKLVELVTDVTFTRRQKALDLQLIGCADNEARRILLGKSK